jgi:N utilization substance protein B
LSEVRSRRAAREAAFQSLYQCVCGGASIASATEEALARQKFSPEAAAFVRRLAEGAVTGVVELDARYAPYLKSGWTPERLSLIDRLVLRLAVFELWSEPEVPPKVTITEAVNLAKRYGSKESGPFINAVLGKALEASPKRDWLPSQPARSVRPGRSDEPKAAQEPVVEDEAPGAAWVLRTDEEE